MPTRGLNGQILRTRQADGLVVRYADSGESPGPTLLMTSPWPESVLAFRRIWRRLEPNARLIAIDLPGFGHSAAREDLFAARPLAEFLNSLIAEWELDRPHLLAPDVGTSAALFLASRHPESVTSITIGSGAVAHPLQVTGDLADIIAAPDVEGMRDLDIRGSVGAIVDAVASRTGEADVWEDYVTSYENGRWAESARYVRSYPTELERLARLLPTISTPIQIICGRYDTLVPASNGQYLRTHARRCKVIDLPCGHFAWEELPDEYADVVAGWIGGGFETTDF